MEALTSGEREALLELGHERAWERGDVVVRAGERADSAIVILEGWLKIHKSTAAGAEVILGLSGAGDLLGEISAVGDGVRSASAAALTPVRAVVLPASGLRRFLASNQRAMLALLDMSLARLHDADARRIEFGTSESLARVTSRLVELAERFGRPLADGTIDVGLPINQEELASWSASSKESTARALRTLRELGLIETQRMRLLVRDVDRLSAHAGRI